MQRYEFELFADYFQFYIQDAGVEGDLSEAWTEEAMANWAALSHGTIGVRTARNMDVPVVIELHAAAPTEVFEEWDKVFECSISVPSGELVVAGCTDYFPDAARIKVEAGEYRARIYYAGLEAVSEDGLDGEDRYRIALWPAPTAGPVALK